MFISPHQPTAMGIHYLYYSLDDMLEAQKRAGYESMELWCAVPHVLLTPEGVADRSEVLKAVKHSGMELRCVTPENCMYPWQFAAKGEALISQSFRYFRHGLELAADLESPYMAVNSGWGLALEPPEEAMKRSLDMIFRLCQRAETLGVTLVMETLRPEESNLVTTLAAEQQFLSTLNHSSLKPMVDTCAMAVAGESLEDWFSAFGTELCHMHFVDGTPYGHLAWGDGNRNLQEYAATLTRHNYCGALTQEITDSRYYVNPEAADIQSLRILKGQSYSCDLTTD